MKRCLSGPTQLAKLDEISGILYSYSHKKFYDFLEINEVSEIIKNVLENSGTNGFIQNHDTLAANEEAYAEFLTNHPYFSKLI